MHHLPNILTSANLFFGMLAMFAVAQNQPALAAWFIVIALACDFFDGFVARLVGASGAFGKELDSLADVVSFGVAPGWIMVRMMQEAQGLDFPPALAPGLYGLALLIPVFSALRLAKFNLDTRQSDRFIGLPTPANTILILSLWLIRAWSPESLAAGWLQNIWVLAATALLSCYLLVAELPLIALKFKSFAWKGNEYRYTLLALCAVLLLLLKHQGIPICILLYVLLSLWENVQLRQKA